MFAAFRMKPQPLANWGTAMGQRSSFYLKANADIKCRNYSHKKARYKTGLLIFGSGGLLCSLASATKTIVRVEIPLIAVK